MGLRRKGRELALQTLYALDFIERDSYLGALEWSNLYTEKLEDIIQDLKIKNKDKIVEFADSILKDLIPHLHDIDSMIDQHSNKWKIDKLALIDRNIMRIAAYEMLCTSTPHAIVMDEAIEISKKFGSESSGKFINGILNAISKDLKVKND